MIDQRQKHVTYGSSFKDFFKGFVDFTGYSSVPGHWFPVGTFVGGFIILTIILFQGVISSLTSIGRKSTRSADYFLGGGAFSDGVSTLQTGLAFGIFMLIVGLILILPLTASFARRLRDVGFATWGIVVLIALYYILSWFTVYLLTPVYCIVFFFVLMSLPSNMVETNSNSEFARFFLRQTPQAQQYYSQFANPFGQPVQYDQFGNPIPNQPQFNNGMNQGFQGQAPQGFNPNAPQGRPQQGFQGQAPQGFNPNVQFGGQPQGFQGQAPQGFSPNMQRGGQPQGFQGQAPQGRPQQGFQGQVPQGFNPNAQQEGQAQEFKANVQPEAPVQSVAANEVQEERKEQIPQEVNIAPEQHVEVVPQEEVTLVEETLAPQVEETHQAEVTAVVAGGARSRRLQKLNRAEEEVGFKKRR